MNYDVFISCKSEDYQYAKQVYEYLVDNGLSVFLADVDLRKKGVAEYGEIIDEALDMAKHLVLVSSKAEYVLTPYVKSEWRTFIEEKRSGRKNGNLITILKDFQVSSLPISLRHFQSFPLEEYPRVIDFLSVSKKDDDTNVSSSRGSSTPKPSIFNRVVNRLKSINKGIYSGLALLLLGCIVIVFLENYFDPEDFDLEHPVEADLCRADTIIADTVEAEVIACDEHMARFPDYLNVDEREVLQKLIDGMVLVEGGTFPWALPPSREVMLIRMKRRHTK